jgi:hypothetical protein
VLSKEGSLFIGLEGGWGQGKSTIAELVKNECGADRVFVFNIWSKFDDNLYKSCCEELILGSGGTLNDISKLNKEKVITTIDNKYYPSKSEVIFLSALLLLPFALDFLLGVAFNGADNFYEYKVSAVASLLISVFVFYYFFYRLSTFLFGLTDEESESDGDRGSGVSSLWGKINSHSENKEVLVGVSWRQKFKTVLRDNLPKKSIVVVDDIDRLGDSGLRKSWEFLSDLKALQLELSSEGKSKFSVMVAYSSVENDNSHGISDFCDKLFDLVYRLPFIPLTESINLSLERLISSFPELSLKKEECRELLMSRWTSAMPSPREAIQIVNEVYAQYDLHNKEIDPFNCLAFCLYRDLVEKDLPSFSDYISILPYKFVDRESLREDSQLQLLFCTKSKDVLQITAFLEWLEKSFPDERSWPQGGPDVDPSNQVIAYRLFLANSMAPAEAANMRAAFILSGLMSKEVPHFKKAEFKINDVLSVLRFMQGSVQKLYFDAQQIAILFLGWLDGGKEGLQKLYSGFVNFHLSEIADLKYVADFAVQMRSAMKPAFSFEAMNSWKKVDLKRSAEGLSDLVGLLSSQKYHVSLLDIFTDRSIIDLFSSESIGRISTDLKSLVAFYEILDHLGLSNRNIPDEAMQVFRSLTPAEGKLSPNLSVSFVVACFELSNSQPPYRVAVNDPLSDYIPLLGEVCQQTMPADQKAKLLALYAVMVCADSRLSDGQVRDVLDVLLSRASTHAQDIFEYLNKNANGLAVFLYSSGRFDFLRGFFKGIY